MRALEDLAAAFLDCSLPKAEWTHEAHLRVGTWHVLRYGRDEAMRLLRDQIPRYNSATGGVNTDTDGYHDTITWFYLVMIAEHLAGTSRNRNPDRMADEIVAALGDRQLPYRYYSKDHLMSVAARRGIVAPDIQALPAAPGRF